ncbi:MAG TPA: hypothetical protein VEI07_25925, partial [Planctomycetaceae bacterium]|nr:hypothetical protein [Planctomycetaceae bacterium]
VLIAPQDYAVSHRDVRIYPAWQLLGRCLSDQHLGRLTAAITSPFLSDQATNTEEQREFAFIEPGNGLVFSRARPRLQRAVGEGLGWCDYESSQMAEWPLCPCASRGFDRRQQRFSRCVEFRIKP